MARVASFRYASLPSYLGPMTTAPIRAATSLPARTFALEIEIPGRGFRCRFVRSLVERVDAATSESLPDPEPDYLDLGRFEPNVILVLRQATQVRFAPGIQKAVSRIGLRVADAAGVVALLR
jgi:hypothetical protein